jgi:hypothetical protein
MQMLISILLAIFVLVPNHARASELPGEFVTRCLAPLVNASYFVTDGLLGPVDLPDGDIGVEGAAAHRQSWQFPDRNWKFGSFLAGTEELIVVRACEITVFDFQESDSAVLVGVMNAMGLSAETCQFKLNPSGTVAFRSIVHKTKRGFPILINYSPLYNGGHLLVAWEILPDTAASPCDR